MAGRCAGDKVAAQACRRRTTDAFRVARPALAHAPAADAGRRLRVCPAPAEKGGDSLYEPGAGPRSDRAGPAVSPPRPSGPVPGRARRRAPRERAALCRGYAALAVPDHHPGDGRFAQHAGGRRRAHPHHRRAGGRKGFHQRPAEKRAPGDRHVCGDGVDRADPDREPRGNARGDQPLPAAARHRHRKRPAPVAGDAVSRRGLRPAGGNLRQRLFERRRAHRPRGQKGRRRRNTSPCRRVPTPQAR